MQKQKNKALIVVRKTLKRFSVIFVLLSKKIHKYSRKITKKIHYHIAHKPHLHLMQRLGWYRQWHGWRYHKHVHLLILATYVLFVAIMMFLSIRSTMAASVINTWDFTNASDFSFDTDTIEISSDTARLKALNYKNDANTMALYHLDETEGNSASDSSSNNNGGNISDATFGVGNLNNSLSFDGVKSKISIADSTSLSLSSSNTLEGWAKLNNPLQAGLTSQRQIIFDKGDYQLYFDNETGKVTYELADASANSWTQVGGNDLNGGWDYNGKRSVNEMVKIGSDVYAGIGVDTGDAEVWRWNGSTWTIIGGGIQSVNNTWSAQTYEGVYSLATDGTNLYVGLGITAGDGEVWRWNGSSWSKIGGDSVNSGWTNYVEQIWTLDYFDGNLYAGIGSSTNDAEVWKWNGSSWSKIGGDSVNSGWTTNYEVVSALTNDGTNLYAGLGASTGDGEVWKWNGTSWSQIGGDSVNSGWDATIETVRSLNYFGDKLYAGLGDSTGDADVWVWNGTSWSQIGGDGLNNSWAAATYEQVTAFAYDGTNLYTGVGTGNGEGEVWKWNGTSWSQIGGDGLNNSWISAWGDTVNTLIWDGSKLFAGTYDAGGTGWTYTWNGSDWTLIGGNNVNKSWGYYSMAAVQVMQTVGDYLYAGLGNVAGSAEVWRWNGSSWDLIGGQGINESWAPNTYEQVMSMASYKGKLIIGLGTTASGTESDGEVWRYDGSNWEKIGGDGVNGSWSQASHYGEVESMAADNNYLYAGLGLGSNDGEVWRYDGSNWEKIGGDSTNSGWTNYIENVYSLAFYKGKLYAGLGRSTGDSEVWEWNGSSWSKIGGDSVADSWSATSSQSVESLLTYDNDLYAGLGYVTGSATLWKYDGSSWSEVGGDAINNSWAAGTYEKVKTLAVYNGALFAGLGNSTGDGEVWRLSDNTWTKVAGNGINSGWTGVVEEVESFSPYKGRLYAGTGLSAFVDDSVWAWGNNAFLQSSTDNFDTNWHHIAATYDGEAMKINIDGETVATKNVNINIPDSSRPLLVGSSYAGREYGKPQGYFNGKLDELRISDVARTSFTNTPYSTTKQTISLDEAAFTSGIQSYLSFSTDETLNGGSVAYRLSDNDGLSWKYWNGVNWILSDTINQANSVSEINDHISSFPVTFDGIKWQAILNSNGNQRVTINSVTVEADSDLTAPNENASNIVAKKVIGGSNITSGNWTNGGSPYFSWDAGEDTGAGIAGYCLYIGLDDSADLVTTAGLFGNSLIDNGDNCQFATGDTFINLATAGVLASPLTTSNDLYYLLIKAIDKAGNLYPTTESFEFKFDNTPPTNPGFISAPSGFISTKDITFTWPTSGAQAPADDASGLDGLQYRIGDTEWYGDEHNGSGDNSDLLENDGTYNTLPIPDYENIVDGINTVYFRTWDKAGNISSSTVNAIIKMNTSGTPSEPQSLMVNPTSNTANSFSFNWDAPVSFVGEEDNLNYCYTINTLPSVSTCNYTGAGITSLSTGPYATQPASNTIYVVARDESNNINYSSYSSVNFTANTAAPGIAGNVDIVDVSIKSTHNWRLAITWDEPIETGDGIKSYKIFRSINGTDYSAAGTSSSTTYIDARLSQQTYHYYIQACDSTNNCSANSPSVSMLPTGKFTEPAELLGEPKASDITTRRAKIQWTTDRTSDSKVSIGTKSGQYGASEIGNSDQVAVHEIDLENIVAGTTYYYKVKWTDEDGNTGESQEYTFTTLPAPVIKEVSPIKITLTSAIIQYTSVGANKVNMYYGENESYGGLKSINTSSDESVYNMEISGLKDGTKYYYKLSAFDSEGSEYDGNIFSFITPPRPRISNLRFQPVEGEPTSTQSITWDTNVPGTSTVTYGKLGTNGIDVQLSKFETSHKITINGLDDNSQYFLIAQSRDADGNLAVSDRQEFKTALDTRPPIASDVSVESSIRGTGGEARGQIIVSWKTDEPSTSQVGYAEGSSATTFSSKTSEDLEMTTEHTVVLSDLPTSKVYSVQPMSYDKSRNLGLGESMPSIIGHADDSVLTIILNALQQIFGF